MRLAIIAGAVALIDLLAHDLMRPNLAERAIEAGVNNPRAFSDIDAEDQNLQDDENVAGAMWVRAHPGAAVWECPGGLAAFHDGCVAAIGKQSSAPNRTTNAARE